MSIEHICPLCYKHLCLSMKAIPGIICPLKNDDYITCPTLVPLATDGGYWCHYSRRTIYPEAPPVFVYTAIIPPFRILYQEPASSQATIVSPKGELCVDKLTAWKGIVECNERIYQEKESGYDGFLKICARFKNLVPFI